MSHSGHCHKRSPWVGRCGRLGDRENTVLIDIIFKDKLCLEQIQHSNVKQEQTRNGKNNQILNVTFLQCFATDLTKTPKY